MIGKKKVLERGHIQGSEREKGRVSYTKKKGGLKKKPVGLPKRTGRLKVVEEKCGGNRKEL